MMRLIFQGRISQSLSFSLSSSKHSPMQEDSNNHAQNAKGVDEGSPNAHQDAAREIIAALRNAKLHPRAMAVGISFEICSPQMLST